MSATRRQCARVRPAWVVPSGRITSRSRWRASAPWSRIRASASACASRWGLSATSEPLQHYRSHGDLWPATAPERGAKGGKGNKAVQPLDSFSKAFDKERGDRWGAAQGRPAPRRVSQAGRPIAARPRRLRTLRYACRRRTLFGRRGDSLRRASDGRSRRGHAWGVASLSR